MLLASKAALSGIFLILLATGVSGPRATLSREANLSKELPLVENRIDVRKLQEARWGPRSADPSQYSRVSDG
jgi:hypothetical protein